MTNNRADSGARVPIAIGLPSGAAAQPSSSLTTPETVSVSLTVNGTRHALILDPRTTLLDLLREHLESRTLVTAESRRDPPGSNVLGQ